MTTYPESTRIGDGDVPFLGLDLAHPPQRIPFGAFQTLTNAYIDRNGEIRFRPGVEKIIPSFNFQYAKAWTTWIYVYPLAISELGQLHLIVKQPDTNEGPGGFPSYQGNSWGYREVGRSSGVPIIRDLHRKSTGTTRQLPMQLGETDHFWVLSGLRLDTNFIFWPPDEFRLYAKGVTLNASVQDETTPPATVIRYRYSPGYNYLVFNQRVWVLYTGDTFLSGGPATGGPFKLLYSPVRPFDPQNVNFYTDWMSGFRSDAFVTSIGSINIPVTAGTPLQIFEWRNRLIILCTHHMVELSSDGPESNWSLDVFLPDVQMTFISAFTYNDLVYMVAAQGVYMTDGVRLEKLDDLLNKRISKVLFFRASRGFLYLACDIADKTSGSTRSIFLVMNLATGAWSELDFEVPYSEIVQYLEEEPNPHSVLRAFNFWRFQPEIPDTINGAKPEPLQEEGIFYLTFSNSVDVTTPSSAAPFFYALPLSFMDDEDGGTLVNDPVYEDGATPNWDSLNTPETGTNFTVTIKTGDYDFGLPEKFKECTFIEFQKEGSQGGDITVNYYINGATTPTATHVVSFTKRYVKAPAPGTFRTIAVELVFDPDNWTGDKDNSFSLQAIGFNIAGVSDAPS